MHTSNVRINNLTKYESNLKPQKAVFTKILYNENTVHSK